MPGFLGGSSGGSGSGGEISFPKEFIDPVTKLRISQPENLIDTDFEYGLQPTKWETVELINNTPSFFSKSGDTTIPGIRAITTNAGTREITVSTDFEHLLSVGIPISVTGTKSVTADGAYIINSIPNSTTFTYLCKANQPSTSSIEDLYSSIITGEFFQGSQLRIADASGIVTNDASVSTLTVTTESSHGFKVNTPFYFLNLNSTISQDFPATNTTAKSFDSTNSATAQTFDGSNTLSSINIDWSNSATVGGNTSSISSISTVNNTITVSHGVENFANQVIGTPLYYSITGGAGYFLNNPRGVVFLKTNTSLGTSTSTFQVSALPDGEPIAITASISGTFQLANQARTFAGNNVNPITQTSIEILKGEPVQFDATNTLGLTGTVTSYSGSNITVTSSQVLDWYTGAMVIYNSSTNQPPTTSPSNLITNNTTYFIDSFFRQGTSNNYSFTLKPLPNGSVIGNISGGGGTQTFRQIGISLDKDIFHVKDNGFTDNEMLEYEYPVGGRFGVATADEIKNFYFIQTRYDAHNFTLNQTTGDLTPLTVSITVDRGTAITPTTATPSGLTAPITFAVTSGVLPSGLSLNTTTGSVSGVPVEVVTGRQVVITATDAGGSTAFQTHTYTVNATIGSISPATVSRENIFSGTAITPTTATTSNLVSPITWAISSGTLPTGLSFNTNNGVISGTPSEVIAAPGRQVIVRATDVGGLQGFQTVTFQINPPPALYSFTTATFTPGGQTSSFGPNVGQARSGVGNPSWANQYINMSGKAGYIQWTVPQTASYRIEAAGSSGGGSSGRQGNGAIMRGTFSFNEGEVLVMVIGQRGLDSEASGGGGGTFVGRGSAFDGGNLLIAAGGGGGYGGSNGNGRSAVVSIQANTSIAGGGSAGNSGNGGGASGSSGWGSAGGGYFSNGGDGGIYGGPGGESILNSNGRGSFQGPFQCGASGGGNGGFGGGGGGGCNGAGGGGGYSGGGASGGGAGSFAGGSNQSNSEGANSGVGYVSITRL
jgi:hypothetical protein